MKSNDAKSNLVHPGQWLAYSAAVNDPNLEKLRFLTNFRCGSWIQSSNRLYTFGLSRPVQESPDSCIRQTDFNFSIYCTVLIF